MNWDEAGALAGAAIASSAAVFLVQMCKRVLLAHEPPTARRFDLDGLNKRSQADVIFRLLSGASACVLFSWVYYTLQSY